MSIEDMTPFIDDPTKVGMVDGLPRFVSAQVGMQGAAMARLLIDTLLANGWTQTGGQNTSAVISAPLGIPTGAGTPTTPKTLLFCPPSRSPYISWINSPTGIRRAIGFAPNSEMPPSDSLGCQWWGYGDTAAGSITNLLSIIEGWFGQASADPILIDGHPTGGYTFTLVDPIPGPDNNGAIFTGDGAFSVGGSASGGFISMVNLGGPGYQQFQLVISAGPATDAPGSIFPDSFIEIGLHHDPTANISVMSDCEVIFYLNAQTTISGASTGPWKMYYGPNHFCLVDSCAVAASDQTLWVCTPKSYTTHTGVFAFGQGDLRKGLFGSESYARSIDGSHFLLNNPNNNPPTYPQVLALRQNQIPLLTPDGVAINTKGIITFSKGDGSDSPGVFGQCQNTIVSTDPTNTRMIFDGFYWDCVGFQTGAFGSSLGDGTFCLLFMPAERIPIH